jgi:pyruvate dehydrogenase E1 component alpha subunit
MKAYDIPSVTVDGMDFFASYEATKKAVEHIRSGKGPFFIEFDNSRFGGQWVGDPVNYKSDKQKEEEFARCGVERFRKQVLKEGLLTEEDLNQVQTNVTKEIEEALKFAEESPLPEISDMFVNTYADEY